MKYTGINIGPITDTLAMARRPRELWSASYLFSHLMKCIGNNISGHIISPSADIRESEVGLYPDRIFFEGGEDCTDCIRKALKDFETQTGLADTGYFNIMTASCEASSSSEALDRLNRYLDISELDNSPKSDSSMEDIRAFIQDKQNPLYRIATNKNSMDIPSLGEIAASRLGSHKGWQEFTRMLQEEDNTTDIYAKAFGKDYRSCDKYICIVQADGDNMGKTFTCRELTDEQLGQISCKLLEFGRKASKEIRDFGGLPVYAGGDDLLFIAPVTHNSAEGGSETIFELIERIDSECFSPVSDLVKSLGLKYDAGQGRMQEIIPSMSYGVYISYYKYPLYEALANAGRLLHSAKVTEGKNALACGITKHSGSSFEFILSRNVPGLQQAFDNLIANTEDGNTVSAVAHKMREFSPLVDIVMKSGKQDRLDAMFRNIFEYSDTAYFNAVKDLMKAVYSDSGASGFGQLMFNMLRAAKFVKGEETDHE